MLSSKVQGRVVSFLQTDRDNYSPVVKVGQQALAYVTLLHPATSAAECEVIHSNFLLVISIRTIHVVQIPSLYLSHTNSTSFQLLCTMDRALDDVISERQVGTMASAREQLTAADVHSEKKPAGWQKK